MSIATEIERIQIAKSDIKTAIENKGVEVGEGRIDTYAEKINEISSGGEGQYENGYEDGRNAFGTQETLSLPDPIALDYVNPTEHNVGIKLESETITDFSGIAVKSSGFNLWDEETEVGGISNKNGTNVDTTKDRLRSKNFIKVKPNTSYYIKCPSGLVSNGGLIQVCRYDENKNFIGYGTTGVENSYIRAGADWHYIRFVIRPEYGTNYNNDICVSLSGSRNGEYEPYIGNTIIANADGTVDGIISISPVMTISTDANGITIEASYYLDAKAKIADMVLSSFVDVSEVGQ